MQDTDFTMYTFFGFPETAWTNLIQCIATASQRGLTQQLAQRNSLIPSLEVLQSNNFLLQAAVSWHLGHGVVACLPVKIMGWNCHDQEFSLKLFNGLLSEFPSYAEISQDGKQISLYQYQHEAKIYYSYKAIARGESSYPTRYLIQAFACTDQQHWDLIIEGEYRVA